MPPTYFELELSSVRMWTCKRVFRTILYRVSNIFSSSLLFPFQIYFQCILKESLNAQCFFLFCMWLLCGCFAIGIFWSWHSQIPMGKVIFMSISSANLLETNRWHALKTQLIPCSYRIHPWCVCFTPRTRSMMCIRSEKYATSPVVIICA